MEIPRDFNQLTLQQLKDFAKIGFDTYWDLIDNLSVNTDFNSVAQHIRREVTNMQKIINQQNQEIINKL